MKKSTIVVSVMVVASLVACSKKDDGAAPSASSSATSSSAASSAAAPSVSAKPVEGGGESKCAALGCKSGDGSFFKMCDCKATPQEVPFEAKYTGKYHSFFKQPEWEVTNKTDKDIHWASANVYYYDKAGKQLEATVKDKKDASKDRKFKSYRINGSNFTLKPKETKKITIGFAQENAPAGAASLEVVFDGWCYGTNADKASHLCISGEKSPDERARSGK